MFSFASGPFYYPYSSYCLGTKNECSVCCRRELLKVLSANASICCTWLLISSAPSFTNRLYEVSTSTADLTSLAVGFFGYSSTPQLRLFLRPLLLEFDHTIRKANGISQWASVASYKNQKFELSG